MHLLPKTIYDLDLSLNEGVTFTVIKFLNQNFTQLSTLSLESCENLTECVEPLECIGFDSLKRLELQGSVTHEDLQTMIAFDLLKNVEFLNLSNCKLTHESLELIFESKNLHRLEYLIFSKNEVKQLPKPAQRTSVLITLAFIDLRENGINNLHKNAGKVYQNIVMLGYATEAKKQGRNLDSKDMNQMWDLKESVAQSVVNTRFPFPVHVFVPTEEQRKIPMF